MLLDSCLFFSAAVTRKFITIKKTWWETFLKKTSWLDLLLPLPLVPFTACPHLPFAWKASFSCHGGFFQTMFYSVFQTLSYLITFAFYIIFHTTENHFWESNESLALISVLIASREKNLSATPLSQRTMEVLQCNFNVLP